MGFIQYLANFLPNLSKESAPLRQLLSNEVSWHLDRNIQQAFEKLKEMVTNTPMLIYFDPENPVLITVDSRASYRCTIIQSGIQPPRRISLALRQRVKDKLKNLEQEGIIVRQSESKDWVYSLVNVIKSV